MKPYFIASDLHMGDGSLADDFKQNKDRFADFLQYVKEQQGRLILAGDVFELWQADLQSILKQNVEIIRLLFALQPRIIAGNHDYYIRNFIDFDFVHYPTWHMEHDTGLVRIEHGHEHDPNNDPERNMQLGKIVASLAGFAENWIHPDVDQAFTDFAGKAREAGNRVYEEIITPWKRERNTGKKQSNHPYLKAADRIRKENEGVSWVVFGHTHNPEIREDYRYVNCGCWVKEVPTFVKIAGNAIGLYEFRGKNNIKERAVAAM